MIKQLLLAFVSFGYLGAAAAPASPATLFAQLFPKTGEIRLLNKGVTPVPFIFYSITSASEALDGLNSQWKSIEDRYDVSGNGFIDPNGEWVKLFSSSSELTEGALDIDGGSLAPQRAISLGRIWDPEAVSIPDLIFTALDTNTQMITISPELALDGDYLPDGVVDQTDYDIWQQYYGSSEVLLADGNLDGVVDAADYVVWRRNFGMNLPSLAIGALSGTALSAFGGAVPEPASVVLLLFAGGGFLMATTRRRNSRR